MKEIMPPKGSIGGKWYTGNAKKDGDVAKDILIKITTKYSKLYSENYDKINWKSNKREKK